MEVGGASDVLSIGGGCDSRPVSAVRYQYAVTSS